ncbi:carboxylesterase family protein [Butyrivibrio sp. YAB3001]|uniref:carboxylesterase family protein n=1 Tax=Butyrivibrio sp. YAB3001 TaxID=1520812 RepID=UPI0008F63FCB|nr:carboxylesterase family protein [Butyrivibrio sp. YAB3001]SFB93737.1 Carboxylesterase type B [Butyrivibrio sp. YAB3001]
MLRETTVENGKVRGLAATDPRVTVYRSIPFAAPPVGKNRWRAPQPCENWDGVLDAKDFAPISVQDRPGMGTDIYCREWHVDNKIEMNEDCLYLNIWTPAKEPDENLPVLVWFFGGGFQWGYTAEMEFNGEQLAKRGIVVVSVNYRLNCFGYLAHPEITKEASDAPSNFGLLDQQAGLNWVYRNIKAFGGNPDQITIAGQSAGGASVMQQLANKKNRNLIKGAAVFSGIIRLENADADIFRPLNLSQAEELGKEFFESLGVSSLEEARALSQEEVFSGYNKFIQNHPRMYPIQDGQFCTGDPVEQFVKRECADVPVIAGNTTDEFSAAGVNMVEKSVKYAFTEAHKNEPSQNFYYYRFDPDIPGDGHPGDSYPGTFHSCDLWFFFNSIDKCARPYTGRHFDLARQMCNYFANFIKTGNPNNCGDLSKSVVKSCAPVANVKSAEGETLINSDYKCRDKEMLPTWQPYTTDSRYEMEFLGKGATPKFEGGIRQGSKKQAVNPYLPSWEYIPDGEPYVFNNRVYVYGSHDIYQGETFCLGDYVTWSAPIDDLGNWHYEGVIYPKDADPLNPRGNMCLYAPDVTVGPDGRYYLYYVLDKVCVVSVAVSDTPNGPFSFYGYVHYEDGTKLGERQGDEPQFDPGVLTEGDTTYLFTGFCGQGDKSRHGAMLTVLDKDMLTVKRDPEFIAPGNVYSQGTSYEGHAFFEAPSIRKHDDTYYFIYSSEVMHELCYATSKNPLGPYEYGGVIVSNCDLHIDSYKKADEATAYGANNHGSIVEIGNDWYIFYHRHTNGTWFSRQGCAEKIHFEKDGSIRQVEITSCGLNNDPLSDVGEYPAYIACNIFTPEHKIYVESDCPRVVQEGGDGDQNNGYIKAIVNGTTIGFKYFDMKDVTGVRIKTRAYYNGSFEVKTSLDGEVLGTIKGIGSNIWEADECNFDKKVSGVNALYLCYKGTGSCSLASVELLH